MPEPKPTDWEALGIAPTDDPAAVKAAYHARLRTNGPEEDPEGFQRLRSAFETVTAGLNRSGDKGMASEEGTAFVAALARHRAAGDTAGAIALVDSAFHRHPPGSAALTAIEDAVLARVALDDPLDATLFRHLADRFDWRDMSGHAARTDPERHAAILDRIAAEDWYGHISVAASDAAGRVERLALMPGDKALAALSDRALSSEERARVRSLFDDILTHHRYTLNRFDGEALALLREAVEGPPLLGDAASPSPAATGRTPPVHPVAAGQPQSATTDGMPVANRKLTFAVVIVAIVLMALVKFGIDHFRSAPDAASVASADVPATDVAIRRIKDPATPWLVTRQEPDGVYVDWSPMVTLRNGLSDIRFGAESPQPTTAMPVPTADIQMGFLAPPSLTYITMRVRTRDGEWSDVRRYSLKEAPR